MYTNKHIQTGTNTVVPLRREQGHFGRFCFLSLFLCSLCFLCRRRGLHLGLLALLHTGAQTAHTHTHTHTHTERQTDRQTQCLLHQSTHNSWHVLHGVT